MPSYDKLFIRRCLGMRSRKKKAAIGIIVTLLLVVLGSIFINSRGNDAYVKIKIHSSKEYQRTMNIDFNHAYMTGTKTMKKFYITKQNQIVLKEENAGYGACEAKIPLIDRNKKPKGTIQINYFKANDWFQSDIDLKVDIKTIKQRQYLQIKVKLKEEGHGRKSEYGKTSIQKQFLLKDNGNYRINLGE